MSLTVTTARGGSAELAKVSDTKYTFARPAGRVTVNAACGSNGAAPSIVVSTGFADGFLNPTGAASRAQFAVIMYRFSQKTAG